MKLPLFILALIVSIGSHGQEEPLWKRINKGHQALKLEKYDSAIHWYNQVWPEVKSEYQDTGKTANFIVVSSKLFDAYLEKKDFSNARTYYYWELEARKKAYGKTDAKYFTTLRKGYDLFYQQGNYSRALSELNDLRKIQREVIGKESVEFAHSSLDAGECSFRLGDFSSALEDITLAKNLIKKISGENSDSYRESLLLLSSISSSLAQYEEQKFYAKEGLANAKKHLGDSNLFVAKFNNSLSWYYRTQGDYNEAYKYLNQSFKLWRAIGKNAPGYDQIWEDVATYYAATRQFDKAKTVIDQVIKYRTKGVGKKHPDYARAIKNQAMIQFELGEYENARVNFETAKDLEKDLLGWQHPEVARSAFYLSRIYNHMARNLPGYNKQAKYWIRECLNVHHAQIAKNFNLMADSEQLRYISEMGEHLAYYYGYFLQWFQDQPELIAEAYDEILRSKGLLYRAQANMRLAVAQSGDPKIQNLFDSLVNQRARVSKLFEMSPDELIKQEIDLVGENAEVDRLDRRLRKASANFDYSNLWPDPTWEVVRNNLKDGEAAVEVTRIQTLKNGQPSDSAVYVGFIVTQSSKETPELVIWPDGKFLEEKAISTYCQSIKFKLKDTRSYDVFWRPIAEKLEGINKVYFSGDGIYHSISLNGLLNPDTEQYVFDEVQLHMLNSTREMGLPIPFLYPKKKESVLLGYPEYNLTDIPFHDHGAIREIGFNEAENLTDSTSERFFSGKNIAMLPGTLTEVDAIKKIFDEVNKPVEVFTGTKATESAVKSWRSPRYAHIATHGFFLKDQQLETKNELVAGVSKVAIEDNPLLRSGLLLSHAKRAINEGGDGVLTAYEVMNLDLSSTQLVVLSACETGLGQVQNGEGVYGLTRAFQIAGAANVMMSLWTVSDEATEKLMTDFYDRYIYGTVTRNKRDAFREAQEELRKKYPHPYYWAAFVMLGRS